MRRSAAMTVTTGRRACVVGIGETEYTKRGGTDKSEYRLALEAVLAAVADAGLAVDDVDGFSTIADERSLPAAVAGDLGVPEVRFLNTTAVPGGGAPCASLGDAVMAVEAGMADVVVVYRSLCQGQFTRIGRMLAATAKPAPPVPTVAEAAAHGALRHDRRAPRSRRRDLPGARQPQPSCRHARPDPHPGGPSGVAD